MTLPARLKFGIFMAPFHTPWVKTRPSALSVTWSAAMA